MNRTFKIGIIPAAGDGVRISNYRYSKVLPKSMLPLMDRPVIEYSLYNMIQLGVKEVYIIINKSGKIIMDYFGNGEEFGIKINYIVQETKSGLGNAIYLLRNIIYEPFIVILGDDVTVATNLAEVIPFYLENNAESVQCVVYEEDLESIKNSCELSFNSDSSVKIIKEKPACPSTNYRGIGIYLLSPKIFRYIEIHRNNIQHQAIEVGLSQALSLSVESSKFFAYKIDGFNVNINREIDLKVARDYIVKYNATKVDNPLHIKDETTR